MERDFMGIVGKEPRNTCSPSVHRPLPTKASTIPQFMPFAAACDEKLNPNVFQPIVSFEAQHQAIPKKGAGIGRQAVHPYAFQTYPYQGAVRYDIPVNRPNLHLSSDPRMPLIASSGSYLRENTHASGCNQAMNPPPKLQKASDVGLGFAAPIFNGMNRVFTPSEQGKPLPATAQLTIFYGGYVNVYNNVSLENAQAIMSLAENRSNSTTNAVNAGNKATIQAQPKMVVAEPSKTGIIPTKPSSASPQSGFSSPISAVSHSAAHSASSSSAPEKRGSKSSKVSSNDGTPSSSDSTMLRNTSVPMMRKLSLARFLDKRKERCTSLSPYPPNGKLPESTGPSPSCPAGNMRLKVSDSVLKEWPWRSNIAKNSTDGKSTINTKFLI